MYKEYNQRISNKKFKCIWCEWRLAIWKEKGEISKEYFRSKLIDQGQLTIELDMEEVDLNVTNKNIRDATYLEVREIILKLKHQNVPAINTGLSKKMDGIWNRYNLKSTGRIYTFGVLKCSEKFKVLSYLSTFVN